MTSTPLVIAQRAFNMVGKYVFNEDKHSVSDNDSSVESTAWGRSMKSTVVFDLASRDFELSLQRDPKSLTALLLYATCIYWNTRFVEGAEKKQLLDTKAGGLFERALNLCTLRSNPKNRNNNGPANIFPQSINTAMDASERQLSKSDILFAWAHTLHREAAFREGWSASQTLQQAVEKAQASYELNPDTNNHYSPTFLLWHNILADQGKVLQK